MALVYGRYSDKQLETLHIKEWVNNGHPTLRDLSWFVQIHFIYSQWGFLLWIFPFTLGFNKTFLEQNSMHWMSFLSARNKVIKCHHPYLGHHLVIQDKVVVSKRTIFRMALK